MMVDDIREAYYFTHDELKILLSGLGFHAVYGIAFPKEDMDREKALQVLHGVIQKGQMTSDGTRFLLAQEVKDIMTQMGNAKKVMTVTHSKGSTSGFCVYVGIRLLISELVEERRNALRFFYIDSHQLEEFLYEAGYLPNYMTIQPDIALYVQSYMQTLEPELHENPSALLKAEVWETAAQKITGSLILEEKKLLPYVSVEMEAESEVYEAPFLAGELQAQFIRLIGQAKGDTV